MGKKIVKRTPTINLSERYIKDLNEEQQKVVQHIEGPALVIAGAGSGKTRALTYRVAFLLEQNIPANTILLVTFTKKAAQEMTKRVETLVGTKANQINAGTFHHIANILLHRYGKLIDISPNFSIIDKADMTSILQRILSKYAAEPKDRQFLPKSKELEKIQGLRISWAKPLEDVLNEYFPAYTKQISKIRTMLTEYQQVKLESNLLDYDDLLLYWLKLLQSPNFQKLKQQIHHIMVDEYQDVNHIQAKIIAEYRDTAKSIVAVGDDAQSIYRFRGADFTHMLNFPILYPGCVQYKIEINYRSTPEILSLANASIRHNKRQFAKNLRAVRPTGDIPMLIPCDDAEEEGDVIASQILENRDNDINLEDQAVLVRSAYMTRAIEQAFMRFQIPYNVRAGIRFFERAHIKDVLALLSLIKNQFDQVAWFRIFELIPQISSVAAGKIFEHFQATKSPLQVFLNCDLSKELAGNRIRKIGIEGMQILQNFYRQAISDPNTYEIVSEDRYPSLDDLIRGGTALLRPWIQKKHPDDFQERFEDLEELRVFSMKYTDLNRFLQDILTQYEIWSERENENAVDGVVISTIHQAKGLEWKAVFIVSLLNGRFPDSRSMKDPVEMEEARRLFYVATTRAKDLLYLTYPQWVPVFISNDTTGAGTKRSIFIDEIEKDQVFEEGEIE